MVQSDRRSYFDIHNAVVGSVLPDAHPLKGIPVEDLDAVLDGAVATTRSVSELLRPYSVLYPDGRRTESRLAFCCLSAAATFPGAAIDVLTDMAALTMLLFGVDDVTDEIVESCTDEQFESFTTDLYAVLAGGAAGEWDPAGPAGQVLAAWSLWSERFHARPIAGAHVAEVIEQLKVAQRALTRERRWTAGTAPLPSYAEYLDNGLVTCFYPLWWVAALGVCGPEPAVTEHARQIESATRVGASCIRLANDVRSFEREKREGKHNAISVLQSAGASEDEAIRRVLDHIAELTVEFEAGLSSFPAELAAIADWQRRSVRFHHHWFMARDTHGFSVTELAAQAASA
ncbi:hypothetical protein DPM19_08850 [Actinomadura craniellae]|uniref:Terpene synthase n=1 Tax=Actinomadura craniellae TaxID=2231787 RepID=A0A365H9P2_9ACTN|nr:terpene synthase family protein [Actinomadura craniellae]RAY15860.1 hypothetical protein DPM19_08850 [Actinomadura craniellae]